MPAASLAWTNYLQFKIMRSFPEIPEFSRDPRIYLGQKVAYVTLRLFDYLYAKNHVETLLHGGVKEGQTSKHGFAFYNVYILAKTI